MGTSAITHTTTETVSWSSSDTVGAPECSEEFVDILLSLFSGPQSPGLTSIETDPVEISEAGTQDRIRVGANSDEEWIESEDEVAVGTPSTPLAFVPQLQPELVPAGVRVGELSLNSVERTVVLDEPHDMRDSGHMREPRVPEKSLGPRVVSASSTDADFSSEIAAEASSGRGNTSKALEPFESAGREEEGAGNAVHLRGTTVRPAPSLSSDNAPSTPGFSVDLSSNALPTAEALAVRQHLPRRLAPESPELRATAESKLLNTHESELQQPEASEPFRDSLQSGSAGVINSDRVSRSRQAKLVNASEDMPARSFASQGAQISDHTVAEFTAKKLERVQLDVSHRAPELQITPTSKDVAHDLQIEMRTEMGKVHIRAGISGDDRVDAVIQAEHREVGTLLAEHAPLLERALADRHISLGTLSIKEGTVFFGQDSTDQSRSQRQTANHLAIPSSGLPVSTEEQDCSTLEEGRLSVRV